MNVRAWLSSGFAVTLSTVLLLAAANAAPADRQGKAERAEGKTTEQVFKNIKVLKGVPADQLIPAMEFAAASLGVHCDFCHVEGHFEKDDKKPKEIARKMMQMMFAINKENFQGERKVTCYSCHRGSVKPVSVPLVAGADHEPQHGAMMAQGGPPAGPPPAGAAPGMMAGPRGAEGEPDLSKLPQPSEVIEQYVQAVGGISAIQKISSRVEKGSVAMFGHQLTVEITAQAPGKYRSVTQLPMGESTSVYDGHEGWIAFPGRPMRAMGSADREAARMDADLQFPADAKEMFGELRVAKPETVNGHEAYQILGLQAGEPPVQMYFDEQSGLLVRLERYAESPLGLYPTQIDFQDYREVDGVKVPFEIITARPGNSITLQLQSVQQNVPIDASTFAKPVQRP